MERLNRRSASWTPEVLALVATVGVSLAGGGLQRYGASSSLDPARAGFQGTAAAWLYWTVVPLVFRFLLFRWILRLGQWWRLLWNVSRLDLRLLPAHPDRTGGFGAIEGAQTCLLPLVAGLSALEAASYADELSRSTLTWDALYLSVAVVVIVDLLLIVGPLLLFIPALWSAHVKGMNHYRALATRGLVTCGARSRLPGGAVRGRGGAHGEPTDHAAEDQLVHGIQRVPVDQAPETARREEGGL